MVKCDICGKTLDVQDNRLHVRDMELKLDSFGGCPVRRICGSCREQLEAELAYGRPEEAMDVPMPRPLPHVHQMIIVKEA